MPFLMTTERRHEYIVRRVLKGESEISFPLPMNLLMKAVLSFRTASTTGL